MKSFVIKHINNILYFAVGKIVPAAVILLLTKELFATLSSQSFEKYSLISSLSITLASFIIGWLSQSNIRYALKDKEGTIDVNESIAILNIVILSCSLLCYVIFLKTIFLILFLSLSIALNRLSLSYFQAIIKPKWVFYQELLRSVILLIYIFSTYVYHYNDLRYAIIWVSFSYLIPSLFIYKEININFSINFNGFKKYLKYGIPMSIWLVISTAYPTLERYILSNTYAGDDLSDYLVMSELLVRGAGIVFTPIMMYLHPLLMNSFDKSENEFNNIFIKSALLLCITSISIISIYTIMSDSIIRLLMPNVNSRIVDYSFVILCIPALWQLCFMSHKKLEALGKTSILSIFIGISLLVFVLLMICFVPVFGVWSGICSQIISLMIYILLVFCYSKRIVN